MALPFSSSEKILVTGSTGQVGSAIRECVGDSSSFVFVSRGEFDLQNPVQMEQFLNQHQPTAIINTAAYTAVDLAEKESEAAKACNTIAPQVMGTWCAQNSAKLIHFSTDYVYPGTGETPWTEESPTEPRNVYAVTKRDGEQALKDSQCDFLVLRTSWVYSHTGKNFVKTMLRLGKDKEELSVVSDQVGTPNYAIDLANASLQILSQALNDKSQKLNQEIYNLSSSGFVSWCEFAQAIFELARKHENLAIQKVNPIPTEDYPTPAQRPLNSRMDTSKIKADWNIELPEWKSSLSKCLEQIYSSSKSQ